MMKPRKVSNRTCVACRASDEKSWFVRIVRTPDGHVVIDPTGKANGRGAYLCAKLAALAGFFYGVLRALSGRFLTVPHTNDLDYLDNGPQRLLGWAILMAWFVLLVVAVYLAVWDQRHRCRTCLRPLRMPVVTGSWGSMLQFGRPRIEYICAYGHGTLREEELQISGLVRAEWTPHSGDLWAELCASGKDHGESQ